MMSLSLHVLLLSMSDLAWACWVKSISCSYSTAVIEQYLIHVNLPSCTLLVFLHTLLSVYYIPPMVSFFKY